MCVIYGLRASDSDVYFYIGSTKFAAEYRLQQHIDYIKCGRQTNRHLAHTMRKIGFENVVVEVIEEVAAEDRFDREREIVVDHLRRGVGLTNLVYNGIEYPVDEDKGYRSPDDDVDLAVDWVTKDKPTAAVNPAHQWLVDAIEAEMAATVAEIQKRFPDEWQSALQRRREGDGPGGA